MKVNLSKTAKIVSIIVLIGMLAGAAALAFPMAVFAQSGQPGEQTPTQPAPAQPSANAQQKAIDRLEKEYQRELKAVDAQSNRLSKADALVGKAQQRIDTLKSQGKDVTSLVTALSDFQEVLKAAHAENDSAAAILKNHAGFDANGKVTDLQQARDTVRETAQQMKQVRRDIRPATRDLLRTIRQFVRDNRKV